MAQVKTSPFSSFCWKNVWHWVVLLALLPFALQGVKTVVNAVTGVTHSATTEAK